MSFAPPSANISSQVVAPGLVESNNVYLAWMGVAFFVALVTYTALGKGPYAAIPAVGRTDLVSSYVGAVQFITHAKEMIQAGYDKSKSGAFRVPQLDRWHVIVSGKKLVEELCKAPDDTLSFFSAIEDTTQSRHLFGPNILTNPYHAELVRTQLTRNLGILFPDIRDEIVHAFDDNIPVSDEWTKVKAHDTVLQIVARASNRIFVGTPLCRDPEYTSLNIRFTIDVSKALRLLNLFPEFLKPLAGYLLTNVPSSIRVAVKHLNPLIEERQRKMDEYGRDYPDKPNDFLSWLMDEAEGEERSPRNLTNRVLSLNFAAIHTSAMTFTHALFHLASRPEFTEPLRKEVETIIAEEGWSKMAMTRMHKLDSFFKESQRVNGLSALSMTRKALKDFTFSDGTRIPKGSIVSAAALPMHYDDEIYSNGKAFDGFRFSEIRQQEGQGTRNHFVATGPEYISFGHGRHACPGRFFAANELKAMMAHIVLTYDIKMENEGIRPENQWFALHCMPDAKAAVLFRRRQT